MTENQTEKNMENGVASALNPKILKPKPYTFRALRSRCLCCYQVGLLMRNTHLCHSLGCSTAKQKSIFQFWSRKGRTICFRGQGQGLGFGGLNSGYRHF